MHEIKNINLPKKILDKKIYNKELKNIFNNIDDEIDNQNINYILYEGPPFANGKFHIGHALNKVIKDITIRWHEIQMYNVSYILGWDCHGIPIENKAKTSNKLSRYEIYNVCESITDKYINIQKNQTISLESLVCKNNSYKTKSRQYVYNTICNLFELIQKGVIYIKYRPNFYSIEEQTNLSFSEIEYDQIQHYSLYFMYKVHNKNNIYVLVYTTQPWTIVGNEFICINSCCNYVLFQHNNKNIISCEQYVLDNKITTFQFISIEEITKSQYICAISKKLKPIIINNKIARNEYTGIVHCAPAHGMEDYNASFEIPNITIKNCIDKKGNIITENQYLKNSNILIDTNEKIINVLKELNLYMHHSKIHHRYPVSWRSKKPVYIMSTEQVMMEISTTTINKIIEKCDSVNWNNSASKKSFICTLKDRKDNWCLSRQRVWGTPICIFIKRSNKSILQSENINNEILQLIYKYGKESWFNDLDTDNILIKYGYKPSEYYKCKDILDVWFDSGCVIDYVNKYIYKENCIEYSTIVEGKDQTRGWFQSIAIINTLLGYKKPFNNVIVHGHIKTNNNKKISKSGEKYQIDFDNIINNKSANILRYTIASLDYSDDCIVSEEIIEKTESQIINIYNRIAYMVGVSEDIKTPLYIKSILNKYTLNKTYNFLKNIHKHNTEFRYFGSIKTINDYTKYMSEYIDSCKDILYCHSKTEDYAQEIRYTINKCMYALMFSLYPIIPSIVIYCCYKLKDIKSKKEILKHIHSNLIDIEYNLNDTEKEKISILKNIKYLIYRTIDIMKKDKKIKTTYELLVNINTNIFNNHDIQDICRYLDVSKVTINYEHQYTKIISTTHNKEQIQVYKISDTYTKCIRCWKHICINNCNICINCKKQNTHVI